ncbi:MAG: redoxin domain-containing protein [Gemmatimonadales bacterium]|nr:redoxin domain-containing protein [Gemmatimonadales bacterium]
MEAKGARLVTLSPQLAEFARGWVEEDGIEFDVLLDLGLGVARDYGLTFRVEGELRALYRDGLGIDLARFNGDESWELPLTSTFVIDRSGTIVYASADPDYTVRGEPADVAAAIPPSNS